MNLFGRSARPHPEQKVRESSFYAFFLLLATVSSASAFATLLDMLNAGSLIYFVEHALR